MAALEEKAIKLTELIMQLSRFLQKHENEIMQTLEADLTLRELKVIVFLGQKSPCIMREIADYMGLAVSTLTGIMDRLVQKGLVVRERPEEDRRIVKVELTVIGREAERWHFGEHMQISRGILNSLNERDQKALLVLMHKVIESDREEKAAVAP